MLFVFHLVCVRACVHACVHACMHAFVCVGVYVIFKRFALVYL